MSVCVCVCVRTLALFALVVCVCVFGCVVVGRVYYNFPRFFYNVEYFVRPKWSFFSLSVAAVVFHLRFAASFSQFSHSKPIRKRPWRASQVSFYVIFLLFNVLTWQKQQMRLLLLPLQSCHNYYKLSDVIKCVARLVQQKRNNNNMIKCQLEFIIVHYSFSYYTSHAHRQLSLVCALALAQ